MLSHSTSLYSALQAIKDDCTDKSKAAKSYSEQVVKEVISPLKELLSTQIATQKSINAKWKSNFKIFDDKKLQVAAAQGKYAKCFAEFDEATANYEKTRELKDITEEKKTRMVQKINQILVSCKEAEKTYKALVYSAKELKEEYSKALV